MMQKIIICNFKMNGDASFIENYCKNINASIFANKIIIAPPNCYLYQTHQLLTNTNTFVASQEVSDKTHGSYTGSISMAMVKDCGARYVIISHAECSRKISILESVLLSYSNDLIPILCIGLLDVETMNLLSDILSNIDKNRNIIIAYEPFFAINSEISASYDDIANARDMIYSQYIKYAISGQMVYGGSVNIQNMSAIVSSSRVDGIMLGRASLDPNTVINMDRLM